MTPRTEKILQQRPDCKTTTILAHSTPEELFQNKVLRPILKLQNELLIASFKNYIKKHKSVYYNLPTDKKQLYIENVIQRDIKYRNVLKGMIIGQFTLEEYLAYTQNSSALNKRMMRLLLMRILDQIQLLEPENQNQVVYTQIRENH
ncbi:MAG: glyoxalase [Flavobacteriaceae bacterium]|nr:glyoxalase [Flavobacteriaceae bacterium]